MLSKTASVSITAQPVGSRAQIERRVGVYFVKQADGTYQLSDTETGSNAHLYRDAAGIVQLETATATNVQSEVIGGTTAIVYGTVADGSAVGVVTKPAAPSAPQVTVE